MVLGLTKSRITRAILWSGIERFSAQIVRFLVGIIITRFVAPEEYGLIAIVLVFVSFSEIFVNGGFSSALLRKSDRTEIDYSTVFYFNVVVSVVFYLLLFFVSENIARFYGVNQLGILTKIAALNLVINSFAIIPTVRLTIHLNFKTQMKISLFSVCISGVIGIFLAYRGYGVWALVVQTLIRNIASALLLCVITRWLPRERFSYTSFQNLFSYGAKILVSNIVNAFSSSIYVFLMGKIYSTKVLGYYSRAEAFGKFPSHNIMILVWRVVYPALSTLKDNPRGLYVACRKYMCLSVYLISFLMFLLIGVSEPLIKLLLTDKWLPAAEILQILSLAFVLHPISAINMNIFEIKGRSDIYLKLTTYKRILEFVLLIISIPLGLEYVCWSLVLTAIVFIVVNIYFTRRIMNYGFKQQFADVAPVFFLASVMCALVLGVTQLDIEAIFQLIIAIMLGGCIYFSGSIIFRMKHFFLLRQLIMKE